MDERIQLSFDRIKEICKEKGMMEYQPFFTSLAQFLVKAVEQGERIKDENYYVNQIETLKKDLDSLYAPFLEENYEESYVNPTFACDKFGMQMGQLLSFLYFEELSVIPFVYEQISYDKIAIRLELFLEIYTSFAFSFEETGKAPSADTVKDILYWYVSDYSEDSAENSVRERFTFRENLAYGIITKVDLCKPNYLFRYGQYISENEIATANYLANLPEKKIRLMADTFTEGFRLGFIAAGKDLSIKETVNIRYPIGFERVVKVAIENFAKMGLKPLLFPAGTDIFSKHGLVKIGYVSTSFNRQAEYDHREDLALFLDGHLVTRKLEVLKESYEAYKDTVRKFAGPACLETFGEKEFLPIEKKEAPAFDDEGRKLQVSYRSKAGEMANSYIHMEERSFTIIAFPIPEIGENFETIFDETIRINTLDYMLYQGIQTTLIDALNKADRVLIKGADGNETDLTVELCKLNNPDKEAKFENCVADVNIPVGEVFTSPVLEGTNGLLHVKKVYINGLKYENLRLEIKDGVTKGGSTTNLPESAVEENIMFHHEFLPMGEFAIGTNTTAYAVACRYNLFEKLPILIAEKTGPHFAFGDTCYSNEEEVHYVNPDGKEMIAKENTFSKKRHTNPEEAYFHCHTDITIPYEEIGLIEAVTPQGEHIELLKNGRFVLPGTEELNRALDELIP